MKMHTFQSELQIGEDREKQETCKKQLFSRVEITHSFSLLGRIDVRHYMFP